MTPVARFRAGLAGLTILTLLGALGYVVIEGAAPLDAVYMVLITITTVGFEEVFELSGGGRVLTLGVIVLGVGLGFYTAGAGIEQLFSLAAARRENRMRKMINGVSDHVIVCGFGRVGKGVFHNLKARGTEVVVVETNPVRVEQAVEMNAMVLEGDATHNETLLDAGLERARALVACVREDADNLVIVLSARALRSDVHIVSRATETESEPKLRLAGADRVVTPQAVGAERLAAMAVEPELAEIFDIFVGGRAVEFAVEEVRISTDSPLVGQTIRDSKLRDRTGALILAVEDRERSLLLAPSPDHVLEARSTVIVVGTQGQVEEASQLLAG